VNTTRANKDLWSWIIKKDERIHGTTHEKISTRFEREQPHLNELPSLTFDTSYRIYRKCIKTVRFILKATDMLFPTDMLENR
jgi:hypothetical protein